MTAAATSPTPQERDARIIELRRARNARLRFFAVRGSLAAGALAVLVVVLLIWLLTTSGGRNALLSQIVARLPDNATLAWGKAEGPASGPLTLHDVRFSYDAIVFTARRVTLDPALRPLLGRRLRLDVLQIQDATLELPASDEPFELPRWPESLPQIAPPLALRADAIEIDRLRITRERRPLAFVQRVRGGLDAQPGGLQLKQLAIDSDRGRFTVDGDYAPAENYRTDLTATAVLPAARGRTPPRLGVVARGDLSRMDVAVSGAVPGPLRAALTLRGDEENPRWQLRANADALDIGLLSGSDTPSEVPLAFQFQADGVGGTAQLKGEFKHGDFNARVLPSKLRLDEQVLDVQPLALELLDGTATVRGRADFSDADDRNFKFAINARGLRWGGAKSLATTPAQASTDTPVITADADLGFAGTVEAWAAIGTAALARDGEVAQLRFDGRGDAERMVLRKLEATMPTGTLDATGDVAWAPALGWDIDATLAGFDPGYIAPGWDGAINGRLSSQGDTRDDGGLDIHVDAPQLGGRLRGRPLDGRAQFTMRGPATGRTLSRYAGEVALSLGDSRIDARGTVADTLDIDANFAPLQLADLLPDAAGTLRGTLQLSGARNAPNVAADLDGRDLRYGEFSAGTISADGRLPWRGSGGTLSVRASGLQAGIPFDTLSIEARGAVEALQLDVSARGDIGTLALAGNADKRGNTWQGALATLQLTPTRGAQWNLQSPAEFRWSGSNAALSRTCLASSAGGSLCANADWPRRGLAVKGQGLPLTLLTPYLPTPDDGRQWLLRGEVALDAKVRPAGASWRGEATVTSASGGLRLRERARRDLVHYDALSLTATFDPQGIQARLGAGLFDDGRIDARIASGWDEYAPLTGEVALATDELTWMELFSPDIVEPQGRLAGRITLGGTRAQPRLGGEAQLTGFTAEMPALAITLTGGNLQLHAQPDGSARIAGSVRSAASGDTGPSGVLNIAGTLGWQGNDVPLVLNLRGRNVLVSDTRDLRAVVTPDVTVRAAAGQPIAVSGRVLVDSATIDLERLDQGVSASPDVVVLDPVDPTASEASPLQLDLALVLGDDVRINGFGLDGSLTGELDVRARPGREMTANGRLDVDGEYTAYGQELQVTRGRLIWANAPVSDPLLDIRAERVVGEVTAGVDVSGRAGSPQARVWSNPASSQSEALAYLALGRPLSTTSGDERGQLNAASAALSAGGSLLASQLGARIGLDDAGVMQSRALGGSVLGIGKQLSPRLYVGFGVSLLGTGQVLTLKYLLSRGFDIEIESSTVENRGSLNWRKEK